MAVWAQVLAAVWGGIGLGIYLLRLADWGLPAGWDWLMEPVRLALFVVAGPLVLVKWG